MDTDPLMVGFVLGPMLEENFGRALLLRRSSFVGVPSVSRIAGMPARLERWGTATTRLRARRGPSLEEGLSERCAVRARRIKNCFGSRWSLRRRWVARWELKRLDAAEDGGGNEAATMDQMVASESDAIRRVLVSTAAVFNPVDTRWIRNVSRRPPWRCGAVLVWTAATRRCVDLSRETRRIRCGR
jgi:hypothetical protein